MKKFLLSVFLLIAPNCFAFNFPTTSVLYSGTGSNVNPLPSSTFQQYGSANLQVSSAQIVGTATSTYGGAYYSVHTSHSKFTEVYATVNTPSTTQGDIVWLLLNFNPGTGSGYELQYYKNPAGVDQLTIQKATSYSLSPIGSAVSQNISAGDSLGLADWNGILYLFYKPNGGNWVIKTTVADSTYFNGALNIGMEYYYTVTSPGLINFGGSNSVMTPVISPPYTCSTNYYIASTGSDSNNGTSSGTPWLTCAHAISTLAGISSNQSGTCVHWATGSYSDYCYDNSIGGSGTSSSGWLVFKSDVYHNAVMTVPTSQLTSTTNGNNFRITGENYVVIDGFELDGDNTTYIFTVSSANATAGATYTYNGSTYTVTTTISGATTLITTASDPNFVIPASGTLTKASGTGDSTITFSALVGSTDNAVSTGIQSQSNPISHITAINNIISNHGGGGIEMNNMDYAIDEGNIVFNNAWSSQYGESGISDYQPVLSDTNTGYHNLIENNLVFNNKEYSDGLSPHTDGNGIIMDDSYHNQTEGSGALIDITAAGGAIGACTVGSSGGTGYVVGDLLGIVQAGASGGQCIVATLSGSAVATATVYTAGAGYTTANNLSINNTYNMDSLIQDNVVFDNGGAGIHIFYFYNTTVINNTSYDNNIDNLITGTYRGDIDVLVGSNDTFANNIAYAIPGSGYTAVNIGCLDAGANGIQNTGNSWYNNLCYNGNGLTSTFINESTSSISNGSPEYNILGVQPQFTNISLNDYSLGDGYPVKGSGTALYGYPSTDFIGSAITAGNIPIGAYQYLASSQNGTDHY